MDVLLPFLSDMVVHTCHLIPRKAGNLGRLTLSHSAKEGR